MAEEYGEDFEDDFEDVEVEEIDLDDKLKSEPVKPISQSTQLEKEVPKKIDRILNPKASVQTISPKPKIKPNRKANSTVENSGGRPTPVKKTKLIPTVTSKTGISRTFFKPSGMGIRSSFQSKNAGVIRKVEQELKLQREKHEALLSDYDDGFEFLSEDKKVLKLRAENTHIREELKRLNTLTSQLIESHKETIQRRGKSVKGPRNEIDLKEIQNAEKQLDNAWNEYERLYDRLEQLSNPQYTVELKERILGHNEKIKKMTKSKKRMEVAQLHREKAMHQVIEDGEPELLQEINRIKLESAIVAKNVTVQDEKIERNSVLLQEQQTQFSEKRQKQNELDKEARSLGIDNQKVQINTIKKPTIFFRDLFP